MADLERLDSRAAGWLQGLLERHGSVSRGSDASETATLIARRHGAAGEAFARLALDPDAERSSLYEAKNATLALSVDSSLSWSGDLYLEQLDAVATLVDRVQPATVVDAGCEQGIVTCFVASIAPDTRVIGIDRNRAAIERARELAGSLGLANATFALGDLSDVRSVEAEGADLTLTSRAVIGEAIPAADDRPPELLPGEIEADPEWTRAASNAATTLARLTKPGGLLLSIERCGSSGAIRWARTLSAAGFSIEAPTRRVLAAEPGVGDAGFRMILGLLGTGPATCPSPSELLGEAKPPKVGECSTGEEAERLALARWATEACEAWEWSNSSGDRERLELAVTAGQRLIEFRSSTNGERSITFHAPGSAGAARSRCERELAAMTDGEAPSVEPLIGRAVPAS